MPAMKNNIKRSILLLYFGNAVFYSIQEASISADTSNLEWLPDLHDDQHTAERDPKEQIFLTRARRLDPNLRNQFSTSYKNFRQKKEQIAPPKPPSNVRVWISSGQQAE